MKLAFTSSNGIMVDTHFGKTEIIYIYEIKRGGIFYKGYRRIKPYASKLADHSADTEKLLSIYNTIKDCHTLYTLAIGETPLYFLQEKGMNIEIARGTINSVFLTL